MPGVGAEELLVPAGLVGDAPSSTWADGVVFTYRGSWCADGFRTSWESAWRIVGERGTLVWDGFDEVSRRGRLRPVREGLFDKVEPVAVPPLDPRDRVGGHLGVMQDFVARDRERHRARRPRGADNIKSLAMVFGAIESAEAGRRVDDHDMRRGSVPNPLLDIRIGTMVRAKLDDPAGYVRQILPLGFESIQPFFWQTLGGKDIPRLAGEIREAIGDADVVVSSLGMFGNPLEDGDIDRETLAGWETLIDNAHLFGTDIVTGFTGRIRGKPLTDSLPRFKEVWGELARRAADKGVRIAFENCAMDGNWASGDWNIAHNPDAWELMFNELPDDNLGLEWEPCHQLVYLIDPDPADPQMGAEDLPRPRQGRDRALGRDPRARHLRQAALRADAHAGLRRQRLDARRSASCGSPAIAGAIDIEGWHDPVYRDELEMTGQVRALNYLKECRGGATYVPNPADDDRLRQPTRTPAFSRDKVGKSALETEGEREEVHEHDSSEGIAPAVVAVALLATAYAALPAQALDDKWCKDVHIRFFVGGAEGDAFGTIVYNGAKQAEADLGAKVDYIFSRLGRRRRWSSSCARPSRSSRTASP